MTNQHKRRRPTSSSYRQPAQAEPPARRGFLDSLFPSSAPGSTPFPGILRSLGQGITLVVTTPIVLAAVPLLLLGGWLAAIAAGYQGPFSAMLLALAYPPLGTPSDTTIASSISGGVGVAGILATFALLLWRALVLSILTTALVERARTGGVSAWAARRAIRVLPLAIGLNLLSLFLLILAQIVAAFFGAGLQALVQVGAIAFGVYLGAFVTTVAADEERTQSDTLRRAVRVARQPGSGNLTLALLYVVLLFISLFFPLPGGLMGVNPSPAAWAVATLINTLHVCVLATFVYRYLVAAPGIDDAPRARRQPPARRR